MSIVLGYERLTVTSANAAIPMTRCAMTLVWTLAKGLPMGTAARATMVETCPRGTPCTLIDLTASTWLNAANHTPPASNARVTASNAAKSQGRRRTRAARASNLARDEGRPEGRRRESAPAPDALLRPARELKWAHVPPEP